MAELSSASANRPHESRADRVLRALRHFASNGVVCELPSAIANHLGCSTDTIQRAIRDLLADGRLERARLQPARSKATAYQIAVESPPPDVTSPQLAPQTPAGTPLGGPPAAAVQRRTCRYCVDTGYCVVRLRRVEYRRHFDAFGRRVASPCTDGRSEAASYEQEEVGPCPFCDAGKREEFPRPSKKPELAIESPWGPDGFWRGRDTSFLRPVIER